MLLRFFLHIAFGVLPELFGNYLFYPAKQMLDYEFLGLLIALIKVERADKRFKCVGENILPCPTNILGLAFREQKKVIHAKVLSYFRNDGGVDQSRAVTRQLPFGFPRVFFIKRFGDAE